MSKSKSFTSKIYDIQRIATPAGKELKVPRGVLIKLSANKPKKAKASPQNSEEYLIQAIEDEESADKWYPSDLAKSLRFYNRAYEGYTKSIELDPEASLDSFYNLSRLLFHVWSNFVKIDQIKLNTLDNIDQCLGSVVKELTEILAIFERTTAKFESHGKQSWDLIYNTALIYEEIIDDENNLQSIDDAVRVGQLSMSLYGQYIRHQVQVLSEILNFKDDNDDKVDGDASQGDNEVNEFEIVTPVAVLDTILSAYRLVQSLYEYCSSKDEAMVVNIKVNEFLAFLQQQTELIAGTDYLTFFQSPQESEELQAKIRDLKNADQYIYCFSQANDIGDVINTLKALEPDNESNFEFYLSSGDLVSQIITNYRVPEVSLWSSYTFIGDYFKKAQLILSQRFETLNSNNDIYSSQISLIAKILISRSDLDYQRYLVANETNKPVLLRNCVNLLKNSVVWTNKPGGLRENIIDQLNRVYLRKKAELRLTYLEKGNVDGVLNDISEWQSELEELKDVYKIT